MSIKQVKIIKIVRTILLALFIYFLWSNHSSFIIYMLIIFCAGVLGDTLPKEYKVGNTFLDGKLKWIEAAIETTIALVLGWILFLFL